LSGMRRASDIDPQYLYLVKNLRGIIYFSKEVDPSRELNWLRRKFRYRDLGVSENLGIEVKWKKLVILPPVVDDPALDSLYQASRFLCGLILLKERSLEDFRRAVVAEWRTKEELSDRDLKFNLRLIDYAVTDLYLRSIELGKKGDLEGRKKLALEDLKRYWRVKSEESGRTLIAYIDPLLMGPVPEEPLFMSLIPALVLEIQE